MRKTLTEQQIRKIIENGTRKSAKVCEQKFYDKPKSLTEQWCEGTLLTGCYYVLSTEDDTPVACDIDTVCDFMIRDVIAPVPSYDEHKQLVSKTEQLEKRLAIATKALKKYTITETHDWIDSRMVAQKALKEMEGVK